LGLVHLLIFWNESYFDLDAQSVRCGEGLKQLLGQRNLEGVLIQADALHRQMRSQFQRKRRIPVEASIFEEGHGRAITWRLRTTPEALIWRTGCLFIWGEIQSLAHDIGQFLAASQREHGLAGEEAQQYVTEKCLEWI
jgi:hypothetical protein